MLNFVSIGLFFRTWVAKKPQILPLFWTSAFCDVGLRRKLNLGKQLQTFLSKGVKIVSIIQRLQGENLCSNAVVHKRDGHINTQHRKKLFKNSPHRRRAKSEAHQTRYGNRRPRARSRTQKTFWGLTHIFRRYRNAENFGGNRPSQIKTPITP